MPESIIKVLIKGDEFDLHRATEAAHRDLEHAGKSHSKFKGVAKAAMLGAGLAAVAYLKSSVEVASKFKEAHDRMDQAFRVTGVEGGKWVADAEKQGQKFGYTRDKIDNALASSVRALGSAKAAHKALNVAEDISAATGMDLQSSTMMVTKATEGNTKSLKKLGIEWTGAAGGAKAVKKAQDGVTKASAVLAKAQDALGVVHMKIKGGVLKGAAANMALMAAQDKVTKATGGVSDAHKKLKDAQEAGGKIVDLLAKKYKGSAADASKTFEGKVKMLHAAFTNMEATVGNKVIPILMKMGDWLGKHKPILIAFATALGVLIAAFVAYKTALMLATLWNSAWAVAVGVGRAATAVATAVQWAFNAAMDANPIMLVVLAIAALAAGLIYAYKHVKWFHAAVDKAWEILQSGFNWIKKNWPLLLAILTGPIGLAVLIIVRNWDKIKGAAVAVFDWIKQHWPLILAILTGPVGLAVLAIVRNWDKIKDGFNTAKDAIHLGVDALVGFITGMPGRIGGAISGLFGGLWDGFKGAVNKIIGAWNNLSFTIGGGSVFGVDLPSHTFDTPNVPYLHSGGVFKSGSSRREGLAMLQDGEHVFTAAQMSGMGGNTYINMPAGIDAAAVVREQRRYDRRNGRK